MSAPIQLKSVNNINFLLKDKFLNWHASKVALR